MKTELRNIIQGALPNHWLVFDIFRFSKTATEVHNDEVEMKGKLCADSTKTFYCQAWGKRGDIIPSWLWNIFTLKWNWQIICPKSHHDELLPYRGKENN